MADRSLKGTDLRLRDALVLVRAFTQTELNIDRLTRWRDPFCYALQVTQGSQDQRDDEHLNRADDRGAGSLVEPVAYKPAWVRTYMHTGMLGPSAEVSGQLRPERRQVIAFQPLRREVARLDPVAPGVVATQTRLGYAAERATIGSTLNLLAPDGQMWGVLHLTVELLARGCLREPGVDLGQLPRRAGAAFAKPARPRDHLRRHTCPFRCSSRPPAVNPWRTSTATRPACTTHNPSRRRRHRAHPTTPLGGPTRSLSGTRAAGRTPRGKRRACAQARE